MGIISTTEVFCKGKAGGISGFYGLSLDAPMVYWTQDGTIAGQLALATGNVDAVDNSATSTINDYTLTGLISGDTYTVSADDTTTFYNEAGQVLASAVVGDVVYGIYELLEVTAKVAGTPAATTYKLVPSGGVSNNFVLVESGVVVSG
jgi:hypothetical protein